MDFLIVLSIIIAMYLIGKFAIDEGQKIERQKEFEKNLKDWDKKINNMWTTTTTFGDCYEIVYVLV